MINKQSINHQVMMNNQSVYGLNNNRFELNLEYIRGSFIYLKNLLESWSVYKIEKNGPIATFKEFLRKGKNWFDQAKIRVYSQIIGDILYRILQFVSNLHCSVIIQKIILIKVYLCILCETVCMYYFP